MKKKNIALALLAIMLLSLVLTGCGGSDKLVLNVYNWGEYISDGSEGTLDTIAAFEDWYEETYGQAVKVNYSTYPSNEDMYNKISSGAVSYDVIIPSDYMIARMIDEDLLLPLNFDNIPNAQYINPSFNGLYFDEEGLYSIPYTYGMVGVIYDANEVDEADVGDWDLLWNEKYADKILQFNNSRDAFATAMYKENLDINSEDKAVWDQAFAVMEQQRPLVYSYVMDEIFNLMEMGEAAIGAYYPGDYFTMKENQAENVDLQFYYPERTNHYVDAICIPACAQNQELAEIFINFLLSEEVAVANAEFTSYASPNSLVYENEGYQEAMGEEAMSVLYPNVDNFGEMYNKYAFRSMSQDMLIYINELWENVKIS